MIPSFDLPKIYNTDRYYSEVDPENVDVKKHPLFSKASFAHVILNPGDMLFIPAGWWHWVRSLDVSISVTFSNFAVKDYNTAWNCE
jgi:ribosomal protein L16 Arg81 hydroxylase